MRIIKHFRVGQIMHWIKFNDKNRPGCFRWNGSKWEEIEWQ